MPYVYILECGDGTFYTGSTWELQRRVSEHEAGVGANYTAKRPPIKLVYSEEYVGIGQAFRREKQIQGWSHAKKKSLVNDDGLVLKTMAKKNFSKTKNAHRVARKGVSR